MKATIKEIYTNNVTTKYGEKQRYDVYFDPYELWEKADADKVVNNEKIYTRDGNVKVSVFKDGWNSDWESGKEVEVDISRNESNGNIYLNGKCPPHLKGRGMNLDPIFDQLNRIEQKLNKALGVEQSPEPQPEPEEEMDDLPF